MRASLRAPAPAAKVGGGVVALTIALWAQATATDAKCMRVELAPKIVTPMKAALPPDGGVLVGYTSSTDAERSDADPSVQAGWKTSAALSIETLAPGLSVYRTSATGMFTITDAKQKAVGTFTHGAAVKLDLPAPAPSALVLSESEGYRGGKEHEIDATFAAIPTQAVAVVLYKVVAGKRTPQSFSLIDRERKAIAVYSEPGHCGWNPPGTSLPAATDDVALAWVDAYGRLSAPSAALKLTKSAARP